MSTTAPTGATPANKKNPLRPANIAKALGIALLLLYALFPFYWMLTTAVDTHANSRGAGILPSGFTLDHFKTVLIDANFFEYIKVSLIVAAGTVLLSGAIALFAAIGVARYRFRLRTVVLVLVLMVQMVPLEALVIPLFLQARTLNMLNSLLGLVIVYLAFSLPFAIWNLKGFVAAVPKELEEAAYIDGAGWFRMFFSILLPLVAPRSRRHERVRVHHRVERVHFCPHVYDGLVEVHGRRWSADVLHAEHGRLGADYGRLDHHRASRCDLLRPRSAPAVVGAHGRRGQRLEGDHVSVSF